MKEKEKENPHFYEFVKQEELRLLNSRDVTASTPHAEHGHLTHTVCEMLQTQKNAA